ncbi:MAG: hypothetical protein KDD62_13260, partial [Bdellovibrionales bacterium]|nr:hypothetical protein [Bdellovibrionales bacterium]
MPRSMLYRRSNRFIQIDFDQLYWPTDFCLQHYFLGQEPCYLGVPLVNQPADQTPGFSYYHISRMIARNRQHYPEHEVNWHAAISELWEDPAETITLVVVGNRQRFKDKNIREFIDQLSEQFRLAGQNYLFLGMDSEERELMAGVPLLPLSSESRSQIGERLAEVGSKLCVLVLEDSELIYLLNACPEVLFASLFTDRVDEAQRDAVLRFNSVISNQKIETLAQWENEADCFYDFGDSGKQVIQGKMLDYCRSQEAVTKSQSIVRQGQLKLVQNALSRDSIAISEPLDMSVILLAHDRTSSELARALRAWQYVDGSDRITFHAVPYGELHEAHELYRSQDIAVTELATTDLHARGYAANQGAQAIESEWLLFVDAQALPAPYLVMLLSHYTKLLRRTTCFYAKGTRLLPVDLPEAWAPESYYEWMHVGMCTWWHQADGALLIKRSLFEQLGGFSENYALWPYDFDDLLLR